MKTVEQSSLDANTAESTHSLQHHSDEHTAAAQSEHNTAPQSEHTAAPQSEHTAAAQSEQQCRCEDTHAHNDPSPSCNTWCGDHADQAIGNSTHAHNDTHIHHHTDQIDTPIQDTKLQDVLHTSHTKDTNAQQD